MKKSRRIPLYGGATLVVAALLWAGFVRKVPADAATRLSGAQMIATLGDYDGALAICDIVREEHPDNLEERVFRATFLAMADRVDEALPAYDEAIRRAVEFESRELRLDLIQDKASLLLSHDRIEGFEAAREELASLGAGHRARRLDGLRAQKEGDWDLAIQVCREAIERDREDANLRRQFWSVLMSRGDRSMAESRFKAAAGDFDEARYLLATEISGFLRAAEARRAMGEAEAALALLHDASLLDPQAVERYLAEHGDESPAPRDRAAQAAAVPE